EARALVASLAAGAIVGDGQHPRERLASGPVFLSVRFHRSLTLYAPGYQPAKETHRANEALRNTSQRLTFETDASLGLAALPRSCQVAMAGVKVRSQKPQSAGRRGAKCERPRRCSKHGGYRESLLCVSLKNALHSP